MFHLLVFINNECVGDIAAIVAVSINNDGGNSGTNVYDYFHYIVALYDYFYYIVALFFCCAAHLMVRSMCSF
jgi:hypothetical protein